MKHELVEWLYIDFTNCMVVSSNLARHKLSFLFAKILFGMNERDQETLVVRWENGKACWTLWGEKIRVNHGNSGWRGGLNYGGTKESFWIKS